jgi:hypothetical protein
VINVTMGLSGRPYRAFIPWSALGVETRYTLREKRPG